jgi:hypothetical protein
MKNKEEAEAIKELMSMSQKELDLVPYDTVKLICQAKGCKRHTKIRDYGLSPIYYVRRYKERWWDVKKIFFLCPKHYPFYNRLVNIYGFNHVQQKIIDFEKLPIQKL